MILNELFSVIQDRKKKIPKNSYVASLLKQGKARICQKITEEAKEVVNASKNESKQRIVEEIADLWFHTLILMSYLNINPGDINKELKKRRKRRK